MNSIFVYKKIRCDGSICYGNITAVDYADAKSWTGANSLLKLSKTDSGFCHVYGSQAVHKKIYELAKSGIRDFDCIGRQLVFGKNKEIFAERADPYYGDFELIEAQEPTND